MADFQFLQNPLSKKWVISAPRRAKRPDVANGMEPVCPFCPGREGEEVEVYRVPNSRDAINLKINADLNPDLENLKFEISNLKSILNDLIIKNSENKNLDLIKNLKLKIKNYETKLANNSFDNASNSDWAVRVLNNKFPFAPVHEVIIHSPDHSKNFDKLPLEHIALIIQTYKQRYLEHRSKGQVYIFHNRGEKGGESLPHPHTQLAVFPFKVKTDTPRLNPSSREEIATVQTKHFYLFCPFTSQWPDEVWIAPKIRGRAFGEITDDEILDFSFVLSRLIQIFDLRHGNDFPFNFYVYPGGDWYLRLIPRLKVIGGFELSTGIFVNTQDPKETITFIKEHFNSPTGELDIEKIQSQHQAEYGKMV